MPTVCLLSPIGGSKTVRILAGMHEAVVRRLAPLVHRLGLEEPVPFSGGVAENAGLAGPLKERLGIDPASRSPDSRSSWHWGRRCWGSAL